MFGHSLPSFCRFPALQNLLSLQHHSETRKDSLAQVYHPVWALAALPWLERPTLTRPCLFERSSTSVIYANAQKLASCGETRIERYVNVLSIPLRDPFVPVTSVTGQCSIQGKLEVRTILEATEAVRDRAQHLVLAAALPFASHSWKSLRQLIVGI